ncbi:Mitogen-Activated Protein Kinase Kinase Kinase 8 [Marasmius crinis-equi]|uniref:Mitogen-Activated Protein Kinase Kinase Kinase 8 n=1 Tax=Marasmius crinis-equi TaxID=585013 RepID=A0ABR3F2P5_9AGAR
MSRSTLPKAAVDARSVQEQELSITSSYSPASFVHPVYPFQTPPRRPHRPSRLLSHVPLPSQIDDEAPVITLHESLCCQPNISRFPLIDLTSTQRVECSHLSASATSPPLPSLTIVHASLPWCITVHSSQSDFVKVADVLYTLRENLQIPLDRSRGRRIDLLVGKTYFAGMSKSRMGGDIWRLHVR